MRGKVDECQWECTGTVIGFIWGLKIELVLFYERVSAVYIHFCSRHSSARLHQLLQHLLQ